MKKPCLPCENKAKIKRLRLSDKDKHFILPDGRHMSLFEIKKEIRDAWPNKVERTIGRINKWAEKNNELPEDTRLKILAVNNQLEELGDVVSLRLTDKTITTIIIR